jgi:magnesium-transporting ATPase (P-type)
MSIGTDVAQGPPAFWSVPAEDLLLHLQSTPQGLSAEEARRRPIGAAPRLHRTGRRAHALMLLLAQFRTPIILILLVAATLSLFLRDATDALIILTIVLISSLLGFGQEWRAADAMEKLLALVQVKTPVLRDGQPAEIPVEQVVPGDLVLLNAGDVIPGDGRILEAKDLFVNEAALTGETFPVEKGGRDRAVGFPARPAYQRPTAAPKWRPGEDRSYTSGSGSRKAGVSRRTPMRRAPVRGSSHLELSGLAGCSSDPRRSRPSYSRWKAQSADTRSRYPKGIGIGLRA